MTPLPPASYSSAVTAIHRALGRLHSQYRVTRHGLPNGTWMASSVDTKEATVSTRSSGVTPVLTLTRQRPAEFRSWTDSRLIAAIQAEPPDQDALHELVTRYWRPLLARCRALTMNSDLAADLVQETWSRVLRARAGLRPDGSFLGYIMAVATNICRDQRRLSRRAGDMAEHRLLSLELAMPSDEDDTVILADVIPDTQTLGRADRLALAIDLDGAFAHLTPRLQEVVVARYIRGESAAAIGRRHDCTEQTITTWLRRAGRLLQEYLAA